MSETETTYVFGARFVLAASVPDDDKRSIAKERVLAQAKEIGVPTEGEWNFYIHPIDGSQSCWVDVEFFPDWFARLTEDFNGDTEAAQVAWALGQRPAGHPSRAKQ